jgi:peptidyl-prolyl cis-trans isomerase C
MGRSLLRMRFPIQAAILLSLAFTAGSCRSKPVAEQGHPLVMLGNEVLVTSEDLEAEIKNRSPTLRSAPLDENLKRDLLHGLIQFELLCREAEKAGMAADDEVHRQLTKSMLNRFTQAELDRDPRAAPDTEAELRAFYEKHKAEYDKPPLLRLLLIVFKPKADETGVPPEARKALAALKARGDSAAVFSGLAREISEDDHTRNRGGETDWSTQEELLARYGAAVVAAALTTQTNQTPEPVRGVDGWYLVRLEGRQGATHPTFDQLKPALKSRSLHDKRADLLQQYEDDLRKRSHVEIDELVLAKVDPLKLGDEHPEQAAPAPAK